MWIFDDGVERLNIKYSYWHSNEPLVGDDDGTYADKAAKVQNKKSYEWQHTISDVVNSLIKAGLVINEIGEYPDLWWSYLPLAMKQKDGSYRLPNDLLPQMWSVLATKP